MMPQCLENRLQAGRHVHVFLHFVDRRNSLAQRGIWREIERYGDGRKLTLVGNGERLRRLLEVCEKALSGTALLMAELVAPAEFAPLLDVEEVLGESAFRGGVRVFADGVYSAEVVSALDPAEVDPEDAKEEEAPVPVAPADALD
jgi:hypothetical protein